MALVAFIQSPGQVFTEPLHSSFIIPPWHCTTNFRKEVSTTLYSFLYCKVERSSNNMFNIDVSILTLKLWMNERNQPWPSRQIQYLNIIVFIVRLYPPSQLYTDCKESYPPRPQKENGGKKLSDTSASLVRLWMRKC